MNTQVIINIPRKLKKAAAMKAKAQGLALSTVFNLAAQAYVDNRLHIGAFDQELAKGLEDIQKGRVKQAEDVFKKLGI